MGDHDLSTLDALDQAALVRSGQLSAAELCRAAIERIEAVNGGLNAVITTWFDEALRSAADPALPDGPFRGVPFLLKDIGATMAGLPTFMGNVALRDAGWLAPTDTPLGARFRAAGFVTLGKTNTPELGRQITTQPLAFGPTRNPWDLQRSAGGSSGGAAVAVAAGMVPVAHANDAGGSTRLPAGYCGLVGLKPTRGRVPQPVPMLLSAESCVSRTVRDSAAVLDAVHGARQGDWWLAPPPPGRTYLELASIDPAPLRIGVLTQTPEGSVHPDCVAVVGATATLLETLGHHVEEGGPDALLDPAMLMGRAILNAVDTDRRITWLGSLLGRTLGPEDVEPFTWALAELGRKARAAELLEAWEHQQTWAHSVVAWWDTFDLLLTPTAGLPAQPLEQLVPPEDNPLAVGGLFGRIMCFAQQFNVTGQPAISVPMGHDSNRVPLGAHLVAAPGREDLLVQIAGQLERAKPWIGRRPLVHA